MDLCRMNSMPVAPWGKVAGLVAKMGESRMLLCEPGNLGCTQRISLNWSQDSIEYSLKTQAKDVPWVGDFITKLTSA